MKKVPIHQETLKLIACLTMLIDHVGAVLIPNTGLRILGRIAFPIYCFLLVEGCSHTRSPKKYGQRLLAGVFLAELPFDFLFYGGFTWQHQNVMLTLFIGCVMILWIRRSGKLLLPLCTCFLAAELLRADYGGLGIVLIGAFLIAASDLHTALLKTGLIAIIFWCMGGYSVPLLNMRIPIQMFGLLALIPIAGYSGKKLMKSRRLQWAFYLFYPVHMLLLLYARHVI